MKVQLPRPKMELSAATQFQLVFLLLLAETSVSYPTKEDVANLTTTSEILTTIGPPVNTTQPSPSLDYSSENQFFESIPKGHPDDKSIEFAYNHIRELPDFVFSNQSYRNLHRIDLTQNRIITVGTLAFKGLRSLQLVDLSYNNITEIGAYTFEFNHRLDKLDLTGNQISFTRNTHFMVSNSLRTLVLSSNKIESLFAYTFVGLPKVRHLLLERNSLGHIEQGTFRPLIELEYLNLAHTGVHRLGLGMFGPVPRIIDLTDTVLGGQFIPALRKVKNGAVAKLLAIDSYQ